MFEVVLVSVFVTLWILLCATLYAYHYFVEVILDLPISGQSPCNAHAALKKIIENLLKDSSNLPRLRRSSDHASGSDKDEEGRTYEDLLATAIINKVITTCQNNLPPSSANSVSSKVSGSSTRHRGQSQKEYFFGEETLESKWRKNDFETSSVSSIDEWLNSESSFGGKKYVDRVSLTIKQEIEDEYPSDSDHGFDVDDTDYFQTSSSLLTEDDANWFLQKRQFQGTHSPVPVPMLVPNPTTEAKVLIGDKEVEDTSDLSDVASDFEETQPVPSRHGLLIESKTVIGGKNSLDLNETCDRESASSSDSGVKEVNSKLSAFEETREQPSTAGAFQDLHRAVLVKTDITIDDDNVEDSSLLSIYSNTEKEAEYTEKYASLPRTILKPVPPSRPSLQNQSNENKYHEMPGRNSADGNFSESDNDEMTKEFEGSYSKKEKEKWSHPVQLKNNPYSKENIEKRIQRSSSAASSVFGPDYYVKQATSPSGQKVRHDEVCSLSPVSPENNYNSIHQAVPAYIQSEEVFEESKSIVATEQNLRDTATESGPKTSISEITSDSDISYTNFYDVENNKVYKQSKNNVQVIIPEPAVVDKKINNIDETEIFKNNPIPKERKTIFIKSNNASRNTPSPSKSNTLPLRKHRSESDLLAEDSFDRPPTVLQKRKDNTLISKIYLDPNVRSFALKRENLPLEYRPALLKQRSLDPTLLQYRRKNKLSVSSDEGLLSDQDSKTGKMSFFSSEEESISSPDRKVQSCSSDEGLLSDSPVQSGRNIYSFSEVLVNEQVAKKKDNTLISKIYLDANVKSFTMNNKNVHEARNNRVKTLYNNNVTPTEDSFRKSNGVCASLEDLSSAGFDSDSTYHSTKLNAETQNQDKLKASDPEITEIARKRLVHNRLGWFSQSQSHLEDLHKSVLSDEKEALNVSVKDLRKKFECNDVKSKVVSSLTARSLSKQIREDLKNEQ